MTFQREFQDFNPAEMPPIPAGWTDVSWRQDTCPSFDTNRGKTVFVDYLDTAEREFPEASRFTVNGPGEMSESTDSWDEVLELTA